MSLDLGYKKTRILNTSDLPGVLADPPMDVEFVNFINVAESQIIGRIASDFNSDDPDLSLILELANKVIIAVYDQSGTRYELGRDCTLDDVIAATEEKLIIAIVTGWVLLIAAEISQGKKKYLKSSQLLNTIGNKKTN